MVDRERQAGPLPVSDAIAADVTTFLWRWEESDLLPDEAAAMLVAALLSDERLKEALGHVQHRAGKRQTFAAVIKQLNRCDAQFL